jgi:pimeloyl-ACP methyl ester carboxylesterase
MHNAAAQTLLLAKKFKMKVSRFRGVAGQSELVLLLLLAPAAVVLFGCASPSPSYEGGRRNILNDDSEYKLAAIEFGELGSYADPYGRELSNAIDLLRSTDRPLLVVYIHGWHNSATSDDVGRFKGFLSRLSTSRQVITNHLNVVGVYFAWSGDSLKIPVVNTLTFWDRKRVAERIASNGDCLDAIEQLSQAARIHERSYTFLIGHSFGGLILERTVEHTLRTLQGQNVKPPWDLALILNPASDSVLARQLVRDLESLYRYDPRPVPDSPLKWAGRYEPRSGGNPISENQPTIVELQSENDSATGLTFPIGSSLGVFVGGHWTWNQVAVPGGSTDPKPRAIVSEREFYLSTPGNSRYLINYVVAPWKVPEFPQGSDAFDYNLQNNSEDGVFYTSAPKNSQAAADAGRQSQSAPAAPTTNWLAWKIQYAGEKDSAEYRGNARVPFWIVRVPSQIIDNHGGIWSDNNMALMAAIFRMHRPIKKQLVTVSGHTVIQETVPAPAKSYVLPARPELHKQK